MDSLLNLQDFAARARTLLPPAVYGYFAGGAADDITLRENETAWPQIRLLPRAMVDVSSCSLQTTILGRPVAMPILTAPCSLNTLAHPDGELATARAVAAVGTLQVVSLGAGFTLETVAAALAAPAWFQLYCLPDRGITRALVERAEKAGYAALCLTGDAPVDGIREHNMRSGFRADLPPTLQPYTLDPAWIKSWHDPSVNWKTVEWLRSITKLPIVIKGILAPADARLAVQHGVEGIIVSNHGGRQMDTAVATARALPAVVAATGGRIEVFVDGGIRRGSDVLKALALGARAVLIGRPYLWGLAVGGEAGARRVLEILRDELRLNMQMAGCTKVSEIGPELIAS